MTKAPASDGRRAYNVELYLWFHQPAAFKRKYAVWGSSRSEGLGKRFSSPTWTCPGVSGSKQIKIAKIEAKDTDRRERLQVSTNVVRLQPLAPTARCALVAS